MITWFFRRKIEYRKSDMVFSGRKTGKRKSGQVFSERKIGRKCVVFSKKGMTQKVR